MKELLRKHREIILYVVFGGLTTLISFATYYLFRWVFSDKPTLFPVSLSWICAVTFAYLTNRKWVFQSGRFRETGAAGIIREILTFYAGRLLTLGVDMLLMFLLVDLTGKEGGLYELGARVIVSAIVLALNYLLSKFAVFGKRK